MSQKVELKLDWATHAAAKYACENWHYSRCIPKSKLVKIGVWEVGKFIGVIIFGSGANHNIGTPYGLKQTQVCELVRIAFREHSLPISHILSIAIRLLKKKNLGLKLVVSYADREQGHHGGVYQASNWIYSGLSSSGTKVFWKGRLHSITIDHALGNHKGFVTKKTLGKHTYLLPLNSEIRKHILPLSRAYPKRAVSKDNVVPVNHTGEGGATPTTALQ